MIFMLVERTLIFPHHENEIAQSEAANGKEFAKYWLHNAFLNIDNRKMSKSLGNFFTVREISEKYDLTGTSFLYVKCALQKSFELQQRSNGSCKKRIGSNYHCH